MNIMDPSKLLFNGTKEALEYKYIKCRFQVDLNNDIKRDVPYQDGMCTCGKCDVCSDSEYLLPTPKVMASCVVKSDPASDKWEKKFECAEPLTKLYCRACNFQADTLIQLKRHFQKKLIRRFQMYKCLRCNIRTYSKLVYLKHTLTDRHIRSCVKRFKCPKCQFRSLSRMGMKMHINQIHKPGICLGFSCTLCSYSTKNITEFRNHQISEHPSEVKISWFYCDFCSYQTKRKRDIRRHQLVRHSVQQIKTSTWKDNLDDITKYLKQQQPKTRSSVEIPWIFCESCSYRTVDKSAFRKHQIRKHTSSENIPWSSCQLCSYRAKLEENLRKHYMSQHADPQTIQWYFCDQCSYKTKRKRCLGYHKIAKHNIIKTEGEVDDSTTQ